MGMREGWLAKPDSSATLDVFFELSEYVLLTDLEVLYGKSFCDKYGARVIPGFRQRGAGGLLRGARRLSARGHRRAARAPRAVRGRALGDARLPRGWRS